MAGRGRAGARATGWPVKSAPVARCCPAVFRCIAPHAHIPANHPFACSPYWDAQGCALAPALRLRKWAQAPATPPPFARHRPRALESRLRAAQPPPRMAATAKPQPPAALLPIPGGAEAAPSNILELYLGSLEALGFDLKKTTSAFVEDDWKTHPGRLGPWAGRCG